MTLAMSRCEAAAGTRCRASRAATNEAGAIAKVISGRKPMKSLEYFSDRLLSKPPSSTLQADKEGTMPFHRLIRQEVSLKNLSACNHRPGLLITIIVYFPANSIIPCVTT